MPWLPGPVIGCKIFILYVCECLYACVSVSRLGNDLTRRGRGIPGIGSGELNPSLLEE